MYSLNHYSVKPMKNNYNCNNIVNIVVHYYHIKIVHRLLAKLYHKSYCNLYYTNCYLMLNVVGSWQILLINMSISRWIMLLAMKKLLLWKCIYFYFTILSYLRLGAHLYSIYFCLFLCNSHNICFLCLLSFVVCILGLLVPSILRFLCHLCCNQILPVWNP